MRLAGILLLLWSTAAGGDRLLLLGVRDETRVRPDLSPPRIVLEIDIHSPERRLETRRLTIFDGKMRAALFRDPFVVPEQPGLAILVAPEERGLRCLRVNWERGTDLGKSFLLPAGSPRRLVSRSVHAVAGRLAFLTPRSVLSLDVRLRTVVATSVGERPLHLDPFLNRLYVSRDRRVLYHPLVPAKPPGGLLEKPEAHFRLPDAMAPLRAALTRDGARIAYSSVHPSHRPDADRFLLSVADDRSRLLFRRSLPGRLHDLRWLDGDRLLVTTTSGEATTIRVVAVSRGRIASRTLDRAYLAPPEIVRADLLDPRRMG